MFDLEHRLFLEAAIRHKRGMVEKYSRSKADSIPSRCLRVLVIASCLHVRLFHMLLPAIGLFWLGFPTSAPVSDYALSYQSMSLSIGNVTGHLRLWSTRLSEEPRLDLRESEQHYYPGNFL